MNLSMFHCQKKLELQISQLEIVFQTIAKIVLDDGSNNAGISLKIYT